MIKANKRNTVLVHLALFLVSLIYGATFTIAKEVMPFYIHPFGLIVMRVGGATLLLWFAHSFYTKEAISKKDHYRLMLCSVFGVAANMLLFFKGLSITTPINAAVIMVTTPLFVAILAFIFLKEKVTFFKIFGLVLGLGSAFVLVFNPAIKLNSATIFGDIYVMLNAVIYSCYLILAKPLLTKYKAMNVIKWTFLYGFILVLPFGFSDLLKVEWTIIPQKIWLSILFLIVMATFLTYLLNGWALRYVNSSVVGTYIYLQPVLATLIAVTLGKDLLTVEKTVYTLFIFIGVYLVSVPDNLFLKVYRRSKA